MSFSLFDAPLREPSQFVGFAGNTIDRQSENRADDSVDKVLTDPTTRLLLMNGGRLHLKLGGGGSLDPWFSVAESEPFRPSFAQGVLLGFSEQGPVLAMPVGIDAEQLPETVKAIDYRSVYMGFAGLPKDEDRANVIAYLRTLSDNPKPLPAPGAAADASAPAKPADAAAPAKPADAAAPAKPAAPAAPAPAAPAK